MTMREGVERPLLYTLRVCERNKHVERSVYLPSFVWSSFTVWPALAQPQPVRVSPDLMLYSVPP